MEKYIVVGDLSASKELKDVSHIYKNYSKNGLKEDEKITLNWRVIDSKSKRTICIFGGGSGREAAEVYKDFCNKR